MNVYMLRGTFKDGRTGYYQRSRGYGHQWVPQKSAAIWTSRRGPSAAQGAITQYYTNRRTKEANRPTIEVKEFVLMKPGDYTEAGLLEFVRVSFAPESDGVDALYIRGELYIHGDYYHNKINERIEGIVEGAKLLFPDVILSQFYVAAHWCGSIYQDGDTPPGTFAVCLKQFPVTSEHPE